MTALLASSFQGLTAAWSTHAHAKTMCLGPTPPVRLVGAFQEPCSPRQNRWAKPKFTGYPSILPESR